MASESGTLYVGMTGNIKQRVFTHKNHLVPGFTDQYNVERLIYVESLNDATCAIEREKQIKRWSRAKKVKLIDAENPEWRDLSEGWYD